MSTLAELEIVDNSLSAIAKAEGEGRARVVVVWARREKSK